MPSFLERLSIRAAALPWWIIILVSGLIIAFYGIITTEIYQKALTFITGNPQIVTTDFTKVTYRVNINGSVQRVLGVLIERKGDELLVRTVDPVTTKIPKNLVNKIDLAPAETCVLDAANHCRTASRVTLTLPARTIEGDFYTETATEYRVRLSDGSIIGVLKVDARATRQLNPPNCEADIAGTCKINVPVPASEVKGVLVSETADQYLIETVAPEFISFNKSQITDIISEQAGVCALNNVGSCQDGIFLSGFLAVAAYIFALAFGLILALMRISANPIARNAAILYVEVVRGIPILVILFIFYFAVGPTLRDRFGIPQPAWLRAVLGLGFAYASFLAEIFRAGIQSIHRGQMEAARSLGMSYPQAMVNVILPQAIRVVLPPLGNDFIAMLKDTSLVTTISLAEMSYLAQQFNSQTLLPFPTFITLAVVYLMMTLFLSFIVRTIEHRVKLPG